METKKETYMTVKEYAVKYGITVQTVYNKIKNKELKTKSVLSTTLVKVWLFLAKNFVNILKLKLQDMHFINNFLKELDNHFTTGYPMPTFYHLVYYNFDSQYPDSFKETIMCNYKIFKPYYKKLKKLRQMNSFPFEINVKLLNELLKTIENNNVDKSSYKFLRREFKFKRNLFFNVLYNEKKQQCCQYCKSENNLSVDHILALINGGKNNISNMQILCRTCNSKKGRKLNFIYDERY